MVLTSRFRIVFENVIQFEMINPEVVRCARECPRIFILNRSVRKERNLEMMNNFKEEKQHLAEELSKNHEKRIERLRDKKNSEIAEMTKQVSY